MQSVPEFMTAVVVRDGKGPPSSLETDRIVTPVPGPGELLIRVRAAGVNRPDVFQRMGLYPPPPGVTDVLGLEVAGEVVHAAGRWKVGDRVCALLAGGGYAEYAVCDAQIALPVPDGLSFEQAAGLPETVFTVFTNLIELGGLKAGETVMIHGATSGIGVTAIQMAKAAGARVIATSRSAEKAEAALGFGADVSVDTSTQSFAETAAALGGVDVILNMVGGTYFADDFDALKFGGRIVFIAALGGADVVVPVLRLMQKRALITGSTLRARSPEEKAALAGSVETTVWPWFADGRMRAQVDRTFPLEAAAEAHAYFETGRHVGKVILTAAAG